MRRGGAVASLGIKMTGRGVAGKEELYRLVDRLPQSEMQAAVRYLEYLCTTNAGNLRGAHRFLGAEARSSRLKPTPRVAHTSVCSGELQLAVWLRLCGAVNLGPTRGCWFSGVLPTGIQPTKPCPCSCRYPPGWRWCSPGRGAPATRPARCRKACSRGAPPLQKRLPGSGLRRPAPPPGPPAAHTGRRGGQDTTLLLACDALYSVVKPRGARQVAVRGTGSTLPGGARGRKA